MQLFWPRPGNAARRLGQVMVLTLCTWPLLISCASLNQFIQTPTVTFDHIDVTKASLLGSTLTFGFKVGNPNPIKLHTRRINYDLKLNGLNFIRGQLDQGLSLPADGVAHLGIPVHINYLDFYKSISQLIGARSAAYELNGSFQVGPLTIPFRTTGTFDLPQAPKFTLETINISQLSWSGAKLICRLRLANPNGFDLLFKHFQYNLQLGQTNFAQATAQPRGPIRKNSAALLDLALDVSFAQIGRSAYQLLSGSKADYHMAGRLVFDDGPQGDQSLPFDLSGRVPLSK